MTNTQFCTSEAVLSLNTAMLTTDLCDASKTWPSCWGTNIASLLSNSLNALLVKNGISIGLQPSDQSFCIEALLTILQKSISCSATDFTTQGLSVGVADAVATEICGKNQIQNTSIPTINTCFETNFNLLNGNNGFKINSSQGDIIVLGVLANVNGAPVLTTEDEVLSSSTCRTFVISNIAAINTPTFDLGQLTTNGNQYGFSISADFSMVAAASVGFKLGAQEGILFGFIGLGNNGPTSFNSFGFIIPQWPSGNIQVTNIGAAGINGFYINVEGGAVQIKQEGAIFWIPNTNSSIQAILNTESLSGTFIAASSTQNNLWYNISHSKATCNSIPCQFNPDFSSYESITAISINGVEWVVVQIPTQDVGSTRMAGVAYVLQPMGNKQIDLNYLQFGQDPSGFMVFTSDPNCQLYYKTSLSCPNANTILVFGCDINTYFFPYPQTISQSSIDLSVMGQSVQVFKVGGISFLSKVTIRNEETIIAQSTSSSEVYVVRSPCSMISQQSSSNVLMIIGNNLIFNQNPSGTWYGLNFLEFSPSLDLDQNAVSFLWNNDTVSVLTNMSQLQGQYNTVSILTNMSQLQGQYYINATGTQGTQGLSGFSMNVDGQGFLSGVVDLPAGKEAFEWQSNGASCFIKDLSIANYPGSLNSVNFVSTVGANGFMINNASVIVSGQSNINDINYIVFTQFNQDNNGNNFNEQICVSDISSVSGQFSSWSQFASMHCCAVLPISSMVGLPFRLSWQCNH